MGYGVNGPSVLKSGGSESECCLVLWRLLDEAGFLSKALTSDEAARESRSSMNFVWMRRMSSVDAGAAREAAAAFVVSRCAAVGWMDGGTSLFTTGAVVPFHKLRAGRVLKDRP
jgi:hypothetical protein